MYDTSIGNWLESLELGQMKWKKNINAHVKEAFEMQDPDIICKLKEHNSDREYFTCFGKKLKKLGLANLLHNRA